MSGICGVVAFGGPDPYEPDVQAMLEAMAYRGPDGSAIWVAGVAALGHASLVTTPEAAAEQLPLIDPASGMAITADARIDNRAELIAALGIEDRRIGDGALILRAFQRWGQDCARHLIGDYAFAIWDPAEQSMFAARDPIGMRQFCYAHPQPGHLVVATDPLAVGAHDAVGRVLNPERIADLFDGMESLDLRATLLNGVMRLEAGHWLRFDRHGLRTGRFYAPAEVPPLSFGRDGDAIDAFLHLFTQSVDARLRSQQAPAAMLSGGLDSASVCAVASDLLGRRGAGPLHSFSITGPDEEVFGETERIRLSAAGISGIEPHFIDYSAIDPHSADAHDLHRLIDPFDASGSLPRILYRAAREQGHNVVLDGVGADCLLNGSGRLRDLLRRGQFRAALREARGEGAFWQDEGLARRGLRAAAVQAWLPAWLRAARRRALWSMTDRKRHWQAPLNRQFADRIGLLERRREFRHRSEAKARAAGRVIIDPGLIVGRERYERAAAVMGVETRDPFLDLRLIDFCRALPTALLQRDGWPKYLLRIAMAGRIPDDVRWARGKPHHGLAASEHLMAGLAASEQDARRALAEYVDFPRFAGPGDRSLDDRRNIIAAGMLYCCLTRTGLRNGVQVEGLE